MADMFRRYRALQPKWRDADADPAKPDEEEKPRSLSMLASTADAVDWGGWREVLEHNEDSIDSAGATALLINHDPNQIAGPLSEKSLGEDGLDASADILPDARMASGVSVQAAVDCGALRGVSIGYSYDQADTDYDEESRTLTVRKWRLLEISLTPTPADARAQVRSLPFTNPESHTMSVPAQPATPAPQPQAVPAVVTSTPSNDEGVRASVMAHVREVTALARSVGLEPDSYLEMPKADAQAKMLRDVAAKNATPEPKHHAAPSIRSGESQEDKVVDAFAGALAHSLGGAHRTGKAEDHQAGNPLLGRGLQHAFRKAAAMVGERTEDWDKKDVAEWALGMRRGARSNANTVTGQFPNFVMLNAVTKIAAKGYEMAESNARYRQIVSDNVVPDFKTFYIGALGVGNLQKTAEAQAFPELDKAELVYSSTAKMWGGTLSLSFEALINDDTGQFNMKLRAAGGIAAKTVDRRVFQKLLMGTSTSEGTSTWTSNTSSGCSPVWTTADTLAAARAKVNTGIVALMNKVGADNNPLGTMPRFFVAGPTAGAYLLGLQNVAPGQTVNNSFAGLPELIITPWLEASALTGNSTTTFYTLGDPNLVTGLVLSKIQGFDTIQVSPYDSGATAGFNWKLWLPFEADLHSASYSPAGSGATATTVIAAAQQCTT